MTLPSQEHNYSDFCHCRLDLPVLWYLFNEFIQYVLFCVWLLLLNIMSPRFIPIVEASHSLLASVADNFALPVSHKLWGFVLFCFGFVC